MKTSTRSAIKHQNSPMLRNRSGRTRTAGIAKLVSLLAFAAVNLSWDAPGHRIITELALDLLPKDAPAWFRDPTVRAEVIDLANVPDRYRSNESRIMSRENNPDHFMDIENLSQFHLTLETLPQVRYEFIADLARGTSDDDLNTLKGPSRHFYVEQVGTLPYAIAEHYEKLVSAFSTMRILGKISDPARTVQLAAAKCDAMHEMGQLSHFVGDAGQPLHTTIHHHGWVGPNPQGYTTGHWFHAYIDGGIVALHALNAEGLDDFKAPMKIIAPDKVWDESIALIRRSFERVEPLYELQKSGDLQKDKGRAFMARCMCDSASVLSGLYWTAWQQAAPTDKDVQSYEKYDHCGEENSWKQ